jgi:glycosyltransferase involved in cell wall biosynthesis
MRVHQMLPRLDAGDAVGNQVMAIHRLLLSWGYEARIFVEDMDDFGRRYALKDELYREFMDNPDDLVIYHYALYCPNYRLFLESKNRKVLVYHNITPDHYYEGFFPVAARLCRLGREVLGELKGVDLALGVSDFNRRELVEAGFPEERTGVLPIDPPLGKLDRLPESPRWRRWLEDGSTNLLFVGRVVPNKKVEDIIDLFLCYYRGVNAHSRLVVAGSLPVNSYYACLRSRVRRLGLEGKVVFTGKVSDEELKTLYKNSHYYVSMSEHEGFCVPILEAFHFGLPVLAYAAAAVPETMGGAGVLFDRKDYPLLAEFIGRLDRDEVTRRRILEAQRRRLEDFDSRKFQERLRQIVERFLPSPGAGEERERSGVAG